MGPRHSVNEGTGREFDRKGNSLKRFRPFSESPDSKNRNFLLSSPSQISAPRFWVPTVSRGKTHKNLKLFAQHATSLLRSCQRTLTEMLTTRMGNQHLSLNHQAKVTLWNFEPQIWLETITSRDAKSACCKGSRRHVI